MFIPDERFGIGIKSTEHLMHFHKLVVKIRSRKNPLLVLAGYMKLLFL
jgi:hypothetical protein